VGGERVFYILGWDPSLLENEIQKVKPLGCGSKGSLGCGRAAPGGLSRVETSNVSLLYSDEKYEIWIDTEKDNITLSMADRGITILFTRDEWLEFQEVIGNILLEEEEEPEET